MDKRYWAIKYLTDDINKSSMPNLQSLILQTKLVTMRRLLLSHDGFSTQPQPEHTHFDDFIVLVEQLLAGEFTARLYDGVTHSADTLIAQMEAETVEPYSFEQCIGSTPKPSKS